MNYIYTIIFNPFFLFWLIFVISVILLYRIILILKEKQFGQVVRDDGPETHLKKSGTPTMAGVAFLIIFMILALLLFLFRNYVRSTKALKIVIFIVFFGFIGLVDDYLKVSKKNTKGLKSLFKFLLQILVAGLGLIVCFNFNIFTNILLFAFFIFIIVGTDNGVNFTDGLDGLCTMVTIVVSVFYILVSIKRNSIELIYINETILAMLLAFLIFNHYPAKAFMGDTGSLFLGAYVAFMAIALGVQYFLPLFGFIYMTEVLSVIMQVSYFKLTHGKRIFKMAPIHHHFEKCGFSETRVVIMFTIVTIITCVITYMFI